MTATPAEIIEYLREHPSATVVEISVALGMTRANIRYHLGRLMKEGQVTMADGSAPGGRGRPAALFRLSRAAQKRNLEGLAGALLAELFEALPDENQLPALRRIAGRIAPPLPPAGNLTRRVTQAVQHLNALAYHARWEAHRDGPRIFLASCPYAGLSAEHSALLCSLDACILENVLGLPVERKSPAGSFPCIYTIRV